MTFTEKEIADKKAKDEREKMEAENKKQEAHTKTS